MKKVIIGIAGLMAACILLTGIFSAGLVVGGLVLADRNAAEAAKILGISRATIYRKLKKMGVED